MCQKLSDIFVYKDAHYQPLLGYTMQWVIHINISRVNNINQALDFMYRALSKQLVGLLSCQTARI